MEDVSNSSQRGSRLERDWTKGSISRNLFALTWPVMVGQGLNMMGPLIDMIWVAKLGAASVAGVGIAITTVTLANAALLGFSTGMRSLVARFVGAGDRQEANHTAFQSLVIGVGYSLVLAVVGIFLAEPILMVFGVEASVVSQGAAYMRILFVGMITMVVQTFTVGMMQASGDTITPMKVVIISRAFHAALCPFLVFGWWIFPSLGVSGAAMTSVMSQVLAGSLGLWFLFGGKTRLRLSLRSYRLDLNIIWRMVKIGIPNFFMHIQHHLSLLVLMWLVSPFGTLAVAAHSLWQTIETILLVLTTGVGTGAAVLGAQNLGAKQPERAVKSGWLGTGFAMVIMLTGLVVVLLWAERIVSIFNSEPDLVNMTSTFLRIGVASYLSLAFNHVLMNFLAGVGDTLAALLLEIIPTWAVLVPLAYFIPKLTDFGVFGIRWSIVTRHFIAAIIFILYFRRGKWQHKRV